MTNIIAQLDAEISKLQQARALLTGAAAHAVKRERGRPKGSLNVSKASEPVVAKRIMSAEGRARIAEAQRKRHAAKKKADKKLAAVAA